MHLVLQVLELLLSLMLRWCWMVSNQNFSLLGFDQLAHLLWCFRCLLDQSE